jgi:choline dehydrogenase-like flavoprotein
MTAGGSTAVSCGNGVRCLEKELAGCGILLESEFEEAERELGVAPIAPHLIGAGSARIAAAAQDVGCPMKPMPKFLDPARCSGCGRCVFGCASGARWSALSYLAEAERNGAELLCKREVREVLSRRGRAVGVAVTGPEGAEEVSAGVVVLCAGGLGTPVILQRSGIGEAGSHLFVDLFVNTCGIAPDGASNAGPPMALVCDRFHDEGGFILSPFVNPSRLARWFEFGLRAGFRPTTALMGIMTKISDEPAGRVRPDGGFSKPVTAGDRERLDKGAALSREILLKAGVPQRSVAVSRPQGAHPGGTAGIGRVVGTGLQTRLDDLFVCDASVLPSAPGLPPILTIVALAKRLAKALS